MRPFPLALSAFAALDSALPLWKLGVEGSLSQQLIHMASNLASGDDNALAFLVGMVEWDWQKSPLDITLIGPYLALDGVAHQLSPPARAVARALHKRIPDPQAIDANVWNELHSAAESDLRNIVIPHAGDSGGLAYLGAAFQRLLDAGLWEDARGLLADFPALPGPVQTRLEAEWAFHALDPESSRSFVEAVEPSVFGLWRAHRLARLTLLQGGTDEALSAYSTLWREIPWHTNLALVLHEMLAPAPAPDANDRDAAARSAVLLYSWNKADVLDVTLARLKQTDLAGARVVVLDNGSTDATPDVLARHKADWPGDREDRFLIETLPVNIGAPAARNWLLSMKELRDTAAVAFLDDDALPESDSWLLDLMTILRRHSGIGAVGCRVTDHTPPYRCQAADFHLHPPDACASQFANFEENIHPTDNGLGQRDIGLFDYVRDCCHVTGCCHLIPRENLEAVGFFDIRFNPTQFDDLERDLRSCAAGFPVRYCGHVGIRHMQHSSLSQADDPAKRAHIRGNKIKLEGLFAKDTVREIVRRDQQTVRNDLLSKIGRLIKTFG